MGVKLFELEEGSQITLHIRNKDSNMQIGANIIKHVKENVALISLEYDTTRRLIFENVQIDVEYCQDNDLPIVWNNVKIVNYKTDYIMQVFSEGTRKNRRDCFRVGVSVLAQLRMMGRGAMQVMIRDISMSGFSISDRKKNWDFV